MRRCEPNVLMATGNGETTPLTVGFSNSSALPPPGDFISRSAISVISSSVATGWEIRFSSPARSRASTNSRKDSNAMPTGYHEASSREISGGENIEAYSTTNQLIPPAGTCTGTSTE